VYHEALYKKLKEKIQQVRPRVPKSGIGGEKRMKMNGFKQPGAHLYNNPRESIEEMHEHVHGFGATIPGAAEVNKKVVGRRY
jgi:hypothetical protein